MEEGGVAFVGGGLEEGGEGGDGEDVGGVEGAAEEHAGGVAEGEEDGRGGALVALGELLGEVLEEGVFVVDLVDFLVFVGSFGVRWVRGKYYNVGFYFDGDDGVAVDAVFGGDVWFAVGEYFGIELSAGFSGWFCLDYIVCDALAQISCCTIYRGSSCSTKIH